MLLLQLGQRPVAGNGRQRHLALNTGACGGDLHLPAPVITGDVLALGSNATLVGPFGLRVQPWSSSYGRPTYQYT